MEEDYLFRGKAKAVLAAPPPRAAASGAVATLNLQPD